MSELSLKDSDARKRLVSLFDDGSFTELDAYAKSANGEVEVVAGFGTVGGNAAYAFSQDGSVDGGAISIAQCAKLKKIYDLATKTGCPIVGIYDSNGVKIKEGFEALSAYGDVVKASTAMSGVCPQISVIAGACIGTTALMANMADVVIATEDADFYVTVPSQVTAKESYESGNVDILSKDVNSAIEQAKTVISLLPANNLCPAPIYDFAQSNVTADTGASSVDIITSIADANSIIELKGGYAKHVVTSIATVMGSTVGFVAFDGSSMCPYCAYKAEAFVKFCDAYTIPIITVANADGFVKNAENQMLTSATRLEVAYATATCPKISLIAGQAVGAAYVTLAGKGANADVTFAWDTAVVSPLDVDSAVAFLFNDRLASGEKRDALEKEYKETLASPFTAAACGAIDDVFVPAMTRAKIISALDMLAGKRENTLPRKHSVK